MHAGGVIKERLRLFENLADPAVIVGGLEAGELVCLSPIEAAVDGMAVRLQTSELAERIVGDAMNPEGDE